MDIAIIDNDNIFREDLIEYVKKKFHGVCVKSFQSVDDLLDQKQVYDFVYMNSATYATGEQSPVYNKYMKHIICIYEIGKRIPLSSTNKIQFVREDHIQKATCANIKGYIKDEVSEAKRLKAIQIMKVCCVSVFVLFMIFGEIYKETAMFCIVGIVSSVLFICIDIYDRFTVKKEKITLQKLIGYFLLFVIAMLFVWRVEILSLLK